MIRLEALHLPEDAAVAVERTGACVQHAEDGCWWHAVRGGTQASGGTHQLAGREHVAVAVLVLRDACGVAPQSCDAFFDTPSNRASRIGYIAVTQRKSL